MNTGAGDSIPNLYLKKYSRDITSALCWEITWQKQLKGERFILASGFKRNSVLYEGNGSHVGID